MFRVGRCQTKALQVELSKIRIAEMRGARHHDIGQRSYVA
jgi:hypothetical protein